MLLFSVKFLGRLYFIVVIELVLDGPRKEGWKYSNIRRMEIFKHWKDGNNQVFKHSLSNTRQKFFRNPVQNRYSTEAEVAS